MSRLMIPRLEEALEGYPLYSQDGKGKKRFAVLSSLLERYAGSSLKVREKRTTLSSLASW